LLSLALAGDELRLQGGIDRLYSLFEQAPVLGSLIDPWAGNATLLEADFSVLEPIFSRAMSLDMADDATYELAVAAHGISLAAQILARRFTLVVTNVPYLGRDKQVNELRHYCDRLHPTAKADLASCFIERIIRFCAHGCTAALVTQQSWLYQDSFKKFRPNLLGVATLEVLARLGPGAFESISGEVVNVCLVVMTHALADDAHVLTGVDVSICSSPHLKAAELAEQALLSVGQNGLRRNPHSKITFDDIGSRTLLSQFATSHLGICTGNYSRFGRKFWELPALGVKWATQHTTVDRTCPYGGMYSVLLWEQGHGSFVSFLRERLGDNGIYAWLRGEDAWGKRGVIVTATGHLSASLYLGDLFDNNVTVIVPKSVEHLPAIWAFCESPEFHDAVRRSNQALKITDQSMVEVPFDLQKWERTARDRRDGALPTPASNDATQWLFGGHPRGRDPLQVGVARLLGYLWPRQSGSSFVDCPIIELDGLSSHAGEDGINIRPFMNAKILNARAKNVCILRVTPKIKWEKDRGKEPYRDKNDFPWFWGWDGESKDFAGGKTFDGNRWNDLHYSRGFKQAARERKRG
jgi:hypothetical protein